MPSTEGFLIIKKRPGRISATLAHQCTAWVLWARAVPKPESVLALDFLWRSFSQALVQADLQGPAGMEDVFPTRSWHPVDS